MRLLSLTIVPIFVFDGPNKPAFKRNKRSRGLGDTCSAAMAKRLMKLFGFAIHDAPGEAEAECALLQQHGVVDAVLSEDVDTIMFGCTRTLRNWSAEGTRGAKTPTHVSVYDVAELKQGETGLGREGLVLVALMSGGDYIPEGVPGCGVKVACEAARAGFGERLCRIKRSDPEALREWREELIRELRTNESKFFRVKHKALVIPEDFPNLETLRYYTHPVVSQAATVERLRRKFPSKKEVNVVGLRAFTAETFDWTYRIGAVKLIRVLAPSLLVQALFDLSEQEIESDPEVRAEWEGKIVRAISTRRIHFSTDATPELRISYVPNEIVDLDLDAEDEFTETETYGRSGLALNSDDEADEQFEDGEGQARSGPKAFDPLQPDLAWVPESVAKLGVPLMVEDWEGQQRAKQWAKKAPRKISQKKASDMPTGALDRYVKSTKPTSTAAKQPQMPDLTVSASQPPPSLPPMAQRAQASSISTAWLVTGETKSPRTKSSKASGKKTKTPASSDVNPWSIASSQTTPKASRKRSTHDAGESPEPILISSSPIAANRLQRPKAARTIKSDSQARRPTRAVPNNAQASIKSFGRVSEAMGKKDLAASETKSPSPGFDSDDDEEFEDVRAFGSKRPEKKAADFILLSTNLPVKDKTAPRKPDRRSRPIAPIEIPSSPPAASPFAMPSTTTVYIPRTSDTGLGLFREVEVTREEADRMMSEQLLQGAGNRRPGGRRMWRESEVTILDLTGDD